MNAQPQPPVRVRVPLTLSEQEHQAITALRTRAQQAASQGDGKPTVEQVSTIVHDLFAVRPLAETGAKMQRATQQEGETVVLDVVSTFGTWLTHSLGDPQVPLVWVKDLKKAPTKQTARRHKTGKKSQMVTDEGAKDIPVYAPVGYEPQAWHRRNIGNALKSVVATRPTPEAIARFVARTYAVRSATLSYPLVAGVWGFAVRGRLDGLHRVSDDAVFLSQALAAYDLLDVARRDAIDAVRFLATQTPTDPDVVLQAIAKARWLNEGEFVQIERAAEAAKLRSNAAGPLATHLGHLAQRVARYPHRYTPEGICNLNVGQVRRIAAAAGLAVEEEDRFQETEIRAQLKELGLQSDADRLVPEALRAAERGKLDEFWDIMRSRLEGDLTWFTQLEDLAV